MFLPLSLVDAVTGMKAFVNFANLFSIESNESKLTKLVRG